MGWSVLDVAVSPAGDCLVYSSWSENLHSVKLTSDESHRSHVPLPVAPDDVQFRIFSVTFSQDDKEILGGSNDGCIYIYDRSERNPYKMVHRALTLPCKSIL